MIHAATVGAHDTDDEFVVRPSSGAKRSHRTYGREAGPDDTAPFEKFSAVDQGLHAPQNNLFHTAPTRRGLALRSSTRVSFLLTLTLTPNLR